jgi:hypothetical protein
MNPDEIEKKKLLWHYDEFLQESHRQSGVAAADSEAFVPIIQGIVLERTEKDPQLIYRKTVEEMRRRWTASAKLSVHGKWHHELIPAILVTALRNNGHPFGNDEINEAFRRGAAIPGGWCGFHGVCGAAVGVGITVSIVDKATPLHKEERSRAMDATCEALRRISALGGPRCCPLSTYTALEYGSELLEEMGYPVERSDPARSCLMSPDNTECHGNDCRYHIPEPPTHVTAPSRPSSRASKRRRAGKRT